jgi:hypothetical protein
VACPDRRFSERRSGVAANAIETSRCAGELCQRTEGRRVEVAAGLVGSVVEVALASVHKVRLRLGRVSVVAPAASESETRVRARANSMMKVSASAPP